MAKGIVILVIVAVAVVVGVAAWYVVTKQPATNSPNVNAAPANTSTEPTTTQPVQTEPTSGDHAIGKGLTYNGVTFTFTSALDDKEFSRETAANGKQYVVLFMQPVAVNDPGAIFTWIAQATTLRSVDASYPLNKEAKIVGEREGGEVGYLWFEVDEGKSGWTLQMGSGDSAQTIELGF